MIQLKKGELAEEALRNYFITIESKITRKTFKEVQVWLIK